MSDMVTETLMNNAAEIIELRRQLRAAETRATDLQARLDAMHSEHDAVTDEWHRCIELNRELSESVTTLRAERDAAQRTLEVQASEIERLRGLLEEDGVTP